LLGGLKPDFKTVADFRRDNHAAFRGVFRQFVLLCRRLDLYGRELLAVDGTRIKAVNNKDRNFTRSSLRAFIRTADERLEDYLKRLDEVDVEDGATSGGARTKNLAEKIAALSEKRRRYNAMLAQLDRTGEDQISLTDPDSRAMAAHTKVGVGYNIQVASDQAIDSLLDAADASQNLKALDLCCGQGNVSEALLKRGCKVFGIDFSPAMLEFARRRAPGATFIEADAQNLPFEASEFDFEGIETSVVSNLGVCHVPDQPRALAEVRRVLRKGGKFAMTVWCGPEASPHVPHRSLEAPASDLTDRRGAAGGEGMEAEREPAQK
jgi:SAM-dependent methyltransferase